jgi:hypothetical protein
MGPPAGAAPAWLAYKASLRAAAGRQREMVGATVLPRVQRFKRPLHHSLMLAAQRKWIVGLMEWWINGENNRWFMPLLSTIQ